MIDEYYRYKMTIVYLRHYQKYLKNKDIYTLHEYIDLMKPFVWITISIIISLAIIIDAVDKSIELKDWSVFARSGSLLVAIALLNALIDYSSFTKGLYKFVNKDYKSKRDTLIKKVIRRRIRQILHKYELNKDAKEIEYMVGVEYDRFIEFVKEDLQEAYTKKSRRFELFLAVIGTLIWGYGDLI